MGINYKFLALGIVLLFLVVSFASSEIVISQLKSTYNLGDELAFSLKLDSLKQSYMDVNLACNGASENLYHGVHESTELNVRRILTPVYIKDLSGSCYVSINYNNLSINSQNFELSREITISLVANNLSYKVVDSLIIKGTAIKKNSQSVGIGNAGFVEVSINELVLNDVVKEGKFGVNFNVPESFKEGNYIVNVRVFDKDSEGNLLNEGKASDSIQITQKPAKTNIAIEKQILVPGENLEIVPFLYDKAGNVMSGQVLIRIEDSKDSALFEGFVPVNEKFIFNSLTNSTPGIGKIIIQKDDISSEKEFEIKELKKIGVVIMNRTMTLTNIGNIAYKGIVKIIIGNEKILKKLDLGIGESKDFQISAPDGIYDITIKDEIDTITRTGISLTGNAISVREIGGKITDVFNHYPIVWLFIVVILIIGVFVFYKNYRTKRKFHFSPYEKIKSNKNEVKVITPEIVTNKVNEVIDKELLKGEIRKAEQTTILHGLNQQAGIIAIKVKNNVAGIGKTSLNKSLEHAYVNKGVSCYSGDYILVIFSPMLTKSKNNEETAVRTALDIDSYLADHNRKFRNNIIDYGIGVNSGEIINNINKGILQFASINKTINIAKKISELANHEVLLSQAIHEKTMNNIKAEKVASGAMNLFAVKRVVDTEKAKQFINEFMKRN